MKKIRMLKSIFFVWVLLIVSFGGYCLYYLFNKAKDLSKIFIDLNINKTHETILMMKIENYDKYLQDKFSWSLLNLFILYLIAIVLIFVLYFNFKNLYMFYTCNELAQGTVSFEKYVYYLEFKDSSNKIHKNHFQRNQVLYKKIFKKLDGKIDISYDKRNPKNFIVGNKPTFLIESFVKPFFLDLFIFGLTIFFIFLGNPFLFLTVI